MARLRSRVRSIPLQHTFPPDDDVAVEMAKLAILAEDLRTTLMCLNPEVEVQSPRIGKLTSEHMMPLMSRVWLTTVSSIQESFEVLQRLVRENPERFGAGSRLATVVQEQLDAVHSSLSGVSGYLHRARSTIAAHLETEQVRAVLQALDPRHVAPYEIDFRTGPELPFARRLALGLLEIPMQRSQRSSAQLPAEQWLRDVVFDHLWTVLTAATNVVALYIETQSPLR